jgi:hypothetical protein
MAKPYIDALMKVAQENIRNFNHWERGFVWNMDLRVNRKRWGLTEKQYNKVFDLVDKHRHLLNN